VESLSAYYRITDENLELRKQFIWMSDGDVRALVALKPWAGAVADALVKEFYDHQFSFKSTREFFENYARKCGMTVDALRAHLEKAQAGYFRQIFEEAAAGSRFGADFFDNRLKVGQIHNAMDLPLRWYIRSYANYYDLVRKYLTTKLRHRPGLRSRGERAVFKIFSFDMQAVTDAFYFSLFHDSIGLGVATISVDRRDLDLSDSYEQLKGAVRETLTETVTTSRLLGDVSARLSENSGQAGEATNQIATTFQQVAAGTQDQAQSTSETSHAMTEISTLIEQVGGRAAIVKDRVDGTAAAITEVADAIAQASDAAGEVSRVSTTAAEAAGNGRGAVRQTIDGMARIRAAVQDTAGKVADLGAKGQQIGAIVETIDDIAAQTNLLALNAAIEAARAGESGRGFAVVADEVRKLAERSTRATKEIAALIAEVQDGTEQAVTAMQTGASEVEAGSRLADRAGAALEEIAAAVAATTFAIERITRATDSMTAVSNRVVGAVEEMGRLAEENDEAARQMTASANHVSTSVESIAAVAEENSAATEEVSAAAEEMAAQVQEVAGAAHSLTELANKLTNLISRFSAEDEAGAVANINDRRRQDGGRRSSRVA
jgi:methyl-accepting chemotaxis protein